jgi:predicted kinase
MSELYLIRGIPGSGKSTFAEKIASVVVSADMYFEKDGHYNFNPKEIKNAHAWCLAETERALDYGLGAVAVANTFTQEWEMKKYLALAEKYGYTVTTLIVENRHGGENIHGVPDSTINAMRDRFEVSL